MQVKHTNNHVPFIQKHHSPVVIFVSDDASNRLIDCASSLKQHINALMSKDKIKQFHNQLPAVGTTAAMRPSAASSTQSMPMLFVVHVF
jgi:hypothetical protein